MANTFFDPFERASRYLHQCLHGSSIAQLSSRSRSGASSAPLHARKCSETLPGQGRTHLATARTAARLCIHDAHSTQQQDAAARCTPPSRCCCRVSSALLHSANRAETLPEQELRLEASMLKRALLVACKVRFHRGSALERRGLHRCEALDEIFRTRTSEPKLVWKQSHGYERRETLPMLMRALLHCAPRSWDSVRCACSYHHGDFPCWTQGCAPLLGFEREVPVQRGASYLL